MKRDFKISSIFLISSAILWMLPLTNSIVHADETKTSNLTSEIRSDKQKIKAEWNEIKDHAKDARDEEKLLREKIRQAESGGDLTAAKTLRDQLKSLHQENVAQKKQDFQTLKDSRKELIKDRKQRRMDKMDVNNDGQVDNVERKAFKETHKKFDNDNNPPGPKGGAGTNWENPPGKRGGPGASPDRRPNRNR